MLFALSEIFVRVRVRLGQLRPCGQNPHQWGPGNQNKKGDASCPGWPTVRRSRFRGPAAGLSREWRFTDPAPLTPPAAPAVVGPATDGSVGVSARPPWLGASKLMSAQASAHDGNWSGKSLGESSAASLCPSPASSPQKGDGSFEAWSSSLQGCPFLGSPLLAYGSV